MTKRKEITMDARLNPYNDATAMKFVKNLNSSSAVVTDSTLPAGRRGTVGASM